MKEILIYKLIDPITNEVRYVGKTASKLYKRLSSHYRDKSRSYKTNWINSLKRMGLKPIIDVIEKCTEENWEEREKYWISFYKEDSKLTNYLDGGQGMQKGYKHTSEAIEKIREAAKKPNNGRFKKNRPWNPKQAEGCWKKILQYDLDGNFIKEWLGIINACKFLEVRPAALEACLSGRCKKAIGFQWRYYSDDYPKKIEKYTNKRKKKNEKNTNNS